MVEPVDYTYDSRARRSWMHKVYYTLVDCNHLTPFLRFVLGLLYNLFLNCRTAVDKFLADASRRSVRLQQQSFLFVRHIVELCSIWQICLRQLNFLLSVLLKAVFSRCDDLRSVLWHCVLFFTQYVLQVLAASNMHDSATFELWHRLQYGRW